MEDFPFTNADTGMTCLMGLIAIMATEVLHSTLIANDDFIDGKKTDKTIFFIVLSVYQGRLHRQAVHRRLCMTKG